MEFNDWNKTPIIKKEKIINFEFMIGKKYISEIEDGYYYLIEDLNKIENDFYDTKYKNLALELGIKDVDLEVKGFIKKLNLYNELKDIGQELLGNIASMKGITIKDVHERFNMNLE